MNESGRTTIKFFLSPLFNKSKVKLPVTGCGGL
jgi:hypothetical protein